MKKVKIFSKITNSILNILIVIFTFFLLASIYNFIQVKVLKNSYASLFGYSIFEVQTGSMSGSIEIGDWILVKNTKDVKIGDVITYKQGESFVTHRVVESYKDTFVTKGDANNSKDKPIDRGQIVGKVSKTLKSFGILKKTIFNFPVIILLIVTFYLINLYLKSGQKKPALKKAQISLKQKEAKKIDSEEKKEEITITDVSDKSEMESSHHFDYSDVINSEDVQDEDDELSKTIYFRKITVDGDSNLENESKVISEDDLSKTSLFRIIKVDDTKYESDIKDVVEDKPANKNAKSSSTKVVLEAEEIEEKEHKKIINKEYITEKINDRKAKNIVDKVFIIKNIFYNEIIDVLLDDEYTYIKKSPFRNEIISMYTTAKYYSTDEDRKKFKTIFNDYIKKLIKKNQNDDTKTKAINLYAKSMLFIYSIEDKYNVDISKELDSNFELDDDRKSKVIADIKSINKYSIEAIYDILEKFKSSSFNAVYNRFKNGNNNFGVYLTHNINFSKVYSKYIVDKTYSEGVVSEDKILVLLNLVSCQIVNDMLNGNYSSKYFVYIPKPLYGKDKKLDRIISVIGNDYAKNHLVFVSTVSNILSNKDDIIRLRKRGYSFALIFDEDREYSSEDFTYILMADEYFCNESLDLVKVKKQLPTQISNNLIIDNIAKRIGEYR